MQEDPVAGLKTAGNVADEDIVGPPDAGKVRLPVSETRSRTGDPRRLETAPPRRPDAAAGWRQIRRTRGPRGRAYWGGLYQPPSRRETRSRHPLSTPAPARHAQRDSLTLRAAGP